MLRQSSTYVVKLAAVLGLAMACEPLERPADAGIDCSAEDGLDLVRGPIGYDDTWRDYSIPRAAFAWETGKIQGAVFLDNLDPPTRLYDAVGKDPMFDSVDPGFYCFADPSLNGYPTTVPWPAVSEVKGTRDVGGCPLPPVREISAGPFCLNGADYATVNRHKYAIHLQSGNHIFWGGEFGLWNVYNGGAGAATTIPTDPATGAAISLIDAAGKYVPPPAGSVEAPSDGLAIWARREIGSADTILVQLSELKAGVECTAVKKEDQQQQTGASQGSVDPNVQANNSSTDVVNDPSACGNRWTTQLSVDTEWALYLLPWEDFYQDLQPNRAATKLNPKVLFELAFHFNRGQTHSLFIDEVMLYRKKP